MTDKLLTLKEAAEVLRLREEDVRRLVDEGRIAAYQIAGMYLRFKEEHVNSLKDALASGKPAKSSETEGPASSPGMSRLKDFIYFNDFYIISFLIVMGLLFIIYKSIK